MCYAVTYLARNPRENQIDGALLVCRGECDAKQDAPPLVHAAATAHRRRVLGLEDGMPAQTPNPGRLESQ